MSWLRGPRRLSEATSGEAPELVAAIRALRGTDGDVDQVRALEQRLAQPLAAPTSVTLRGLGMGAKVGLCGLLFAAAGTLSAIWYGLGSEGGRSSAPLRAMVPERGGPPVPRVVQAPSLEPPAMPAPAEPPAPEDPRARDGAEVGVGEAKGRYARSVRRPARPKQVVASRPDAEAELSLLQRSQGLLDREPAAALVWTERHAREYPRGIFVEEREILAIEALLKLKQKQRAVARAARFLEAYPESAHARRVQRLLAASSGDAR